MNHPAEHPSEFPRERTWLLPALQEAQHGERWLSPDTLDRIAAHLRIPKSEVWGVASHYPELRLTRPGRRIVRVCTGVSCRVLGGRELLAACEQRLGVRAGQTSADGAATLEELDCAFACSVAPVVEVDHALQGRVMPGDLAALLGGVGHHHAVSTPTAVVLTGAASGSPTQCLAALVRAAQRGRAATRLVVGVGSCSVAVGARETIAALRDEVARRKLPHAVGAAGCHGMCWAAPTVTVLREGSAPVVIGPVAAAEVPRLLDALSSSDALRDVSGDVMGPQHRVLLERCGLIDADDIADALRHDAYATFARALEAGAPERVIEEVRAAGLAGRGGAYFQTAVKSAGCRAAAGAPKYIVVNGEEGEPGIFKDRHLMEGDPHRLLEAVLLAAYAVGAARGGAWFAGLGGGRGTKLFGLSGHVRRPGVVEMELGCTLRTLIDTVGGGSSTGRPIRAAVVGGPSGSVVNPRHFDEPLIPRGPVNPGTGGVVALDERASVRDVVRTLLAFNTRESCGKCTPCREGTARLLAMLDAPVDQATVKQLSEVIQLASLCGLGQAAPFAVLSGLAEFPGEFGVS